MLLRIKFPSERLWQEREISLGWLTGVSWLTTRSREHMECEVVVGRRLIRRSIGWLIVMLSMCMWKLNEHSMSGAEHS